MNQPRVAMVFAHPGHEILVAGLMQRYQPDLFFLTRSDAGNENGREELARAVLQRFGLEQRATFADLSEKDSFQWVLKGQMSPYLELRDRLLDWLRTVQPTLVFGDAFELTNFHHDLCRAMLDSALRIYSNDEVQVTNFECPTVCRTAPVLWQLRLQEFPSGPFEVYELSAPELAKKKELIDWVGLQRADAAMARSLFPPIHREVYRRVPDDRDYAIVPTGLQKHYDDWGRFQVSLGRYSQAVLFEDHFVPIAQELGVSNLTEAVMA